MAIQMYHDKKHDELIVASYDAEINDSKITFLDG